jgi:hypothetical protein
VASSFCFHHSDSLSESRWSIRTPESATGHWQRRHSAERLHRVIVKTPCWCGCIRAKSICTNSDWFTLNFYTGKIFISAQIIKLWTMTKTDPWSASRRPSQLQKELILFNAHVSQPSRSGYNAFFCILFVASTAQ